MNEFSTYEFAVHQKIQGKYLLARIALITVYVLYIVGGLLIAINTAFAALFALAPLTLWIIVFFTWRFTDVDYEYSITSGELTFAKIYGNRMRRRVLKLELRSASVIAPLDNAEHSAKAETWRPERAYSAVSSMSAPDIYYILFEDGSKGKKDKKRAIFYFEATAKALQICRFYNPSATILTQTTR